MDNAPTPSTSQAAHIPGSPAPAAAPAPTSTAAPASTPAAPAPAAASPAPPAQPAPAAPAASPPGSPTTLLGSALQGEIEWKPPSTLGDLDPTVKTALNGWASKNGFSAEQANTIFDVAPAVLEFVERQQLTAFKAEQAAWKEAVQKEHGTAFKQAEADALAFVRRNGDKELVEFLEEYGAGNNPAVVRAYVKGQREYAAAQAEIARLKTFIRERTREDSSALEGQGHAPGGSGPQRTPQQILYDHPDSQPAARR